MMPAPDPGTHRVRTAARASVRLSEAAAAVAAHPLDARVLVVAPTLEAGSRVLRRAAEGRPAAFGWERTTLGGLAARIAASRLAAEGRATASTVVIDAVCARTIHRLRREGALGRYARVGDRPGLPRTLARTFVELGLAGVSPDHRGLEPSLAAVYAAYRRDLADSAIADRTDLFRHAILAAREGDAHPLLDLPLVWLDPAIEHALEAELVAALSTRSPIDALLPAGDNRSATWIQRALGVDPVMVPSEGQTRALGRLREHLFASELPEGAPMDESVDVISAPGESRECVEIARRVLQAAEAGIPFDRMAVLAHAPGRYAPHLVEAFRRAQIPAWFSRGTVRPDPSGRALMALLACREQKLSARAFAEYLSLGAVPEPDLEGAPPSSEREVAWLAPEDEDSPSFDVDPDALAADAPDNGPVDPTRAVVRGTLRAPWRWEKLIVQAAVIDADRWRRRLEGLAARLKARFDTLEPDDPARERIARDRQDLTHLMAYALPLIEELARLPDQATWGEWATHLDRLARRALRKPERVLAVLRELGPMAPIGPVGLAEVQLVLGPRLSEMRRAPSSAPAGKLLVGSTSEARGLSFDLVFVPGLVERVFPRKVSEDPICLDRARAQISEHLATREDRVERERLALRLAIGAADQRLVLSYPRVDTERGRARVPSFYALEVLRAVEGTLPSFEELGRRAEAAGAARMAWPAPSEPEAAIDGAEYDLAVLGELLRAEVPDVGAARYLLSANRHLARALHARYARWQHPKWTAHDGLTNASDEARAALAPHAPASRPYSATALEQLAACPYRFYLASIVKLEPGQVSEPLETLDPLTRGRLLHEAQEGVLRRLREENALPVTESRLPRAREVLEEVMAEVAERFQEEHAPSIDRVFHDAIDDARADLAEWLIRLSDDPTWVPIASELAFGMPDDPTRAAQATRDPASTPAPVSLSEGLTLRGAIDLVEARGGALRVTDHKTGTSPERNGPITDGGQSLQPVLYARVLESLRPEAEVVGGRLWYCTARGGFEERHVALSPTAREAVATLAETLDASIREGFLPAFPSEGACTRCAYVRVCGPAEERRVTIKKPRATARIRRLRKLP